MDPRVEAFNFFLQKGWTPEQAAGIVGNLAIESTTALNPLATGDNGTAFGIAQWRGARQAGLRNFAAANGLDYRDRFAQLAYVDHELNTSEKRAGDLLRGAKNPAEAAFLVSKHYERPGVPHMERRIAEAHGIFGSGPMTAGVASAEGVPTPTGTPAASAPPFTVAQMPQAPAKTGSEAMGLFAQALSGTSEQKAPAPEASELDIFSDPKPAEAPQGPFAAAESFGIEPSGVEQPDFSQKFDTKRFVGRGLEASKGPFQRAATPRSAKLPSGGAKVRKS